MGSEVRVLSGTFFKMQVRKIIDKLEERLAGGEQTISIERVLAGSCAALSITLIGLGYLFDDNSLHTMTSAYLIGSLAFYAGSRYNQHAQER